jgi:hypothetical protein
MVARRRSRLVALDINREIAYILGRAEAQEGRLVTLGPLLFFSTDTGDAWMLDLEDSFALCLARDGSPLPVTVEETVTSFAVSWEATFVIAGSAMTFNYAPGHERTIVGYPTDEIRKAMRALSKRY